jgi:phosphate ABC transporter phosphate-binding protein
LHKEGIAFAQLPAQGGITIDGAGATFPFPLIDTWRVEYQTIRPDVSINYQSIGSGGGVKQFTEKTVDFGATDAPLTDEEMLAAPGAVHIPETIGSVVAIYNVEGIDKGLKLTGPVLADIFMGTITKWDDQKIKEINPDLSLPSADIAVVHRSDGSGTTFIWTSYLAEASPEWNQTLGSGKAVEWPVGVGAPGNEGVASTVLGSPNTIGYAELSYALTSDIDYAFLENREGQFIEPSLNSTRAAVEALVTGITTSDTTSATGADESTPESSFAENSTETAGSNGSSPLPAGDESWTNVTLLNAPGEESYPIASFSYLLLHKEMSDNPRITSMEKAKAIVDFVEWAINDGQDYAEELAYVPLPEGVVQHNMETLRSLTFQGQPILEGTGQTVGQ